MSTEWDTLILGGNELKTVGPETENARRANSIWMRGTNSRGVPAEHIGLAGTATVNMSWRYGGVDVISTLWVSHRGLVRDAVFHRQSVQRPQQRCCICAATTLADDAGEVV